MLAFFRNEMGFGGNNGLTDFKDLLGFDLQADGVRLMLFVSSGVALIAGYLLSRFIIQSRLGRVAMAIRDGEDRTRFLGYRVYNYKSVVVRGVGHDCRCCRCLVRTPGRHHQSQRVFTSELH